MKKIIMIKSVFDDPEVQTLEECFNPITVALTDALFAEAHPFGSKLRKKVSVEDIANRRIRFALYKIDKADEATDQKLIKWARIFRARSEKELQELAGDEE